MLIKIRKKRHTACNIYIVMAGLIHKSDIYIVSQVVKYVYWLSSVADGQKTFVNDVNLYFTYVNHRNGHIGHIYVSGM